MSDPAVDAAARALLTIRGHGISTSCEIESAREALSPIRQLHDEIFDLLNRNGFSDSHADGMRYVLGRLEKFIFTSEELAR